MGSVMVSPRIERQHEKPVTTAGEAFSLRSHQGAEHQRGGKQHQIQELLAAEADAAGDESLELAEGDGAAAEGDRADDAARDRQGSVA